MRVNPPHFLQQVTGLCGPLMEGESGVVRVAGRQEVVWQLVDCLFRHMFLFCPHPSSSQLIMDPFAAAISETWHWTVSVKWFLFTRCTNCTLRTHATSNFWGTSNTPLFYSWHSKKKIIKKFDVARKIQLDFLIQSLLQFYPLVIMFISKLYPLRESLNGASRIKEELSGDRAIRPWLRLRVQNQATNEE